MNRRGQIVIIVAVALMALLFLLALAVDGGRLYVERGRLDRSAQAGADAGISWVAEQMVTLAVARQTQAVPTATATCSPTDPACPPTPGTPPATTATPDLDDVAKWLTDADRAKLVSSAYQATAEAVALDYAGRNDVRRSDPEVVLLEVEYPHDYDPDGPVIQLLVRVRRKATVLLAGLLGREFVELPAEGLSEVPQR